MSVEVPAMSVQVPDFANTSVEDIPKIVSRVRNTFFTHKTRSVQFRIKQLRKLYWAIKDNEAAMLEACKRDLGKGYFEGMLSEITWVQNDIVFMTKNLEKWAQDEKPDDISFTNKIVSPRIRKDPLGSVLVIGLAPSSPLLQPELTKFTVPSISPSTSPLDL